MRPSWQGDLGLKTIDLGCGAIAIRVAEALGDAARWIIIGGVWGMGVNIEVKMRVEPDLGLVGETQETSCH